MPPGASPARERHLEIGVDGDDLVVDHPLDLGTLRELRSRLPLSGSGSSGWGHITRSARRMAWRSSASLMASP
jgi:hypothetical protein